MTVAEMEVDFLLFHDYPLLALTAVTKTSCQAYDRLNRDVMPHVICSFWLELETMLVIHAWLFMLLHTIMLTSTSCMTNNQQLLAKLASPIIVTTSDHDISQL